MRSSSLVPANDPTLLFTNAGMNQFKDVFLGLEKRDYSRAASSQKCVRAGGKHNDLENVGYTRRHHTFFEMLGNFSFGDYFKAEAIDFAWELLTKDYGLAEGQAVRHRLPRRRRSRRALAEGRRRAEDRIFRLDEKDNFWQMGDTGPCGPCSEIHYDLRPEAAEPGREHEAVSRATAAAASSRSGISSSCSSTASAEGVLTPLPRPSIDTGMGLERIAAVLQGKLSNYETDLLRPIIEHAREPVPASSTAQSDRIDTALRICADHARAAAFLIHDGVIPSNEGRGYVLRKIMRRAMRNARMIGVEEPFLYKLTGFVADYMKPAYPEMLESMDRVARSSAKKSIATRTPSRWPSACSTTKRRTRRAACSGAPPRSSCTTPSAWRSMSRKRWRASSVCGSTALDSTPRWSGSANARAPVGRAGDKASVAPIYSKTEPNQVEAQHR